MNRQRRYFTLSLLMLVLLLTGIFGCAQVEQNKQGTVAPANRIILGQATTGTDSVWQTDDLELRYHLAIDGDTLRISGTLQIKDSVLNSFPRARFFYLYCNLLDNDGHLLSQHMIRPNLSFANSAHDPVHFSGEMEKPKAAVAIAFGYWGQFFGGGDPQESSPDWEIYSDPFHHTK